MPTPFVSPQTARIIEWNLEKGYGFLQVGTGRIFLHRRDFAEHHKRPAVGDVVCFTLGQDARGRTCARNAVHVNDGGRITSVKVMVLACLLVLPAVALYRQDAGVRWVAAVVVVVMGLTSYFCYVADKRRARERKWRLSEAKLHLTALLGGWPGAFLAQQRLRHKISKADFQVIFWMIVLAYQFAALDSLQNWQLTRATLDWIARASEQRR